MAYGLIFDVDGVLADTEGAVAQATAEMFRELYNHEFVVEDFEPFIGSGPVHYVQGAAEKAGLVIDLDHALAVRQEKFKVRLEKGEGKTYPGAKELIAAAAADPNWRLGLATSSVKEKSEMTLRAAGIEPNPFRAWICSNMIKRPKPNAEIYVTAALAMQLPPTRCVAIEDSILGVKAVKNACMKCVAVTNTFSRNKLNEADVIVDSLEEVTIERLTELLESAKGQKITWGARRKQAAE